LTPDVISAVQAFHEATFGHGPMIAPFAELVRLSRTSIADEMREEHRRRVLGE
jgi:hypothetical protein